MRFYLSASYFTLKKEFILNISEMVYLIPNQ
jgi:hypothetical protein